jgi:hypothetical protein
MDDHANELDNLGRLEAVEQADEQARLAQAKTEAQARGKEPFDLDRLEVLYDTESDLGQRPRQERWRSWEWKYYVQTPELMSLDAFAAYQRSLDPHR